MRFEVIHNEQSGFTFLSASVWEMDI